MSQAYPALKCNGLGSKQDPFQKESIHTNQFTVEATIVFNVKDEDLSVISDLKLHSILNDTLSNFSIIKDYKILEKLNLEKKFIYLNDYSNMSFIYMSSDNYYIKNDGNFLKADVVEFEDVKYLKDVNLYRLFEFNEENFNVLYGRNETKYCEEAYCGVSFDKNIISKPLIKES